MRLKPLFHQWIYRFDGLEALSAKTAFGFQSQIPEFSKHLLLLYVNYSSITE